LDLKAVSDFLDEFRKNPTDRLLIDYSSLESRTLFSNDTGQLIKWLKEFSSFLKNGKLGIVSDDNLIYGLSRMLELLADSNLIPIKIQVFRERKEADEWMELPIPPES